MNKLLEDNRSQLINRSKSGADYLTDKSKGRNRYARRTQCTVANSVTEFNSINMNKLFKDDILDVNIKVKGEDHTNDTNVSPKDRTQKEYIVTIKMGGIMANLQRELNSNTAINSRQIIRALVKSFNGEDIYVRCSCPDWKYRFGYFALKHSISSFDDVFNTQGRIVDAEPWQQEEPLVQTQAPKYDRLTNKYDNRGPACKHVLMVLTNNTWLYKVAAVLSNYIKYMEKNMPDLYQKIIYPALYEKEYTPMSEYDMEDEIELQRAEEEPLDSEEDTIDISNKWAREKDKFKKGNQKGIKFASPKKQIDFDNLVSDNETR